jgi:hypothetical protein
MGQGMSRMDPVPFFRRVEGGFQPTDMARGFWTPADNLHARVIMGLMAHEIERLHGEAGWFAARFTVDLYRLPNLATATVETRLVKQGGRIKVVDAEFFSGGISSARATCQILRRTEQPEGDLWRGARWDAPAPEALPADEPPLLGGRWSVRTVATPAGSPRRAWIREVRPLVDGLDYTPFTRIATGLDYVSPLSNASERRLGFINSDATLYLHRPPVGEWVGYEVTNHQSSEGVAIGQCNLHDAEGPVGFASCTALAQRPPDRS